MQLKVKLIPLILVVYLGFHSPTFAQRRLIDVSNEYRISQKTKNYIFGYRKKGVEFFSELEPSTLDHGFEHRATYYYPIPTSKLIEVCLKTNPAKLWNSQILQLNMIYVPHTDSLCFVSPDSDFQLKEEQILFITLRYFAGFYKLNTALKVTLLDKENGIFEFCYLKGGKSIGKQRLRFYNSGDGGTVIEHFTHYQSHSKLRDKRLYPHFHTLAINELHKNLKNLSLHP